MNKFTWRNSIKKYWQLYLLLIPVIAYFIIFKYIPMVGVQIAFKDFSNAKGIWGSDWIGLENFMRFFRSPVFTDIISNTVILSLFTLIFTFPAPIILALIVNELRVKLAKKALQNITYAPHFLSTIVVVGMMGALLSPSIGIINTMLIKAGIIDKGIYFMNLPQWFRPMYIISDLWKNMGWNAIIFISALSSIDVTLYEAARVDGASKWQQMKKITVPLLVPTIMIMLILTCGNIMSIGFEKVFLMQTDLNLSVSEVISTYVYKTGLVNNQYSYATAIDLFNSVINFSILIIVNKLSKKYSDNSLW